MKVSYMILTAALLLMSVLDSEAQTDKSDVRRGNRDFRKENYSEAEIDYRKALVKDSTSIAANYNLANTLYRKGDMEQAHEHLSSIEESVSATSSAADFYYNLGDVAIARQDWQGAVDAFRESLLRNPDDLDAKENYIYARLKLKDQQNQNQNQNQDQNQDRNQQNQNQQNQNQNQNQDQNQDRNQQDQNQDQPKISPQAAQQMLQAIQAKEKETQDKVNKQKAEALKSRQKDKNW